MRSKLENAIFFLEVDLPRLLLIIIPYAASFIPASLLYENLTKILEVGFVSAFIIAAATEGIGILCAALYLNIKKFNKKNTAAKHQQNAAYVIFAYGIYISSVIVTNAFLDFKNQPIEFTIARILLSLLSVSGALIFSSNHSMASTNSEIKRAKSEREQKQAKSKQEQAKEKQKAAKASQEQARLEREQSEIESARFACNFEGCDFAGKSQNSLNAHQRKHKEASK